MKAIVLKTWSHWIIGPLEIEILLIYPYSSNAEHNTYYLHSCGLKVIDFN